VAHGLRGTRPAQTLRVVDEHRAVIDAIAAGDPDAAATAIHQHITNICIAVPPPDGQE
jgi:DNA-binding GntR family transcriptional regulator